MGALCTFSQTVSSLAVVTIRGGPSEEEYDALFNSIEDTLSRGRPFVLFMDVRGAELASARQRSLAATFIHDHSNAAKQMCLALLFLTDSALVEGGLAAISWLVKMPFPMKVFKHAESLVAYVQEHVPEPQGGLIAARLQKYVSNSDYSPSAT